MSHAGQMVMRYLELPLYGEQATPAPREILRGQWQRELPGVLGYYLILSFVHVQLTIWNEHLVCWRRGSPELPDNNPIYICTASFEGGLR